MHETLNLYLSIGLSVLPILAATAIILILFRKLSLLTVVLALAFGGFLSWFIFKNLFGFNAKWR